MAGTTGCASLAFEPHVQAVGAYKNMAAVSERAADLREGSASDVTAMVERLPAGIAVKEHELVFDEQRYELLGKVSADFADPAGINLGLWFYGYRRGDKWRHGLCDWQVPLSWMTLTMWSYLSPTYHACRVNIGTEEQRRDSIVEALQRATKALGGDLVIVSGFGGRDFVTVDSKNERVVVEKDALRTLSGVGYAFRTKRVSTTAPKAEPAVGAVAFTAR